jgi:hypothetical protein
MFLPDAVKSGVQTELMKIPENDRESKTYLKLMIQAHKDKKIT